jgi:hypothetical protein
LPPFVGIDVDKGARWANEISKELAESSFGIIVLTRDNLRSPWINFEAGAISRMIGRAKVCPIVFGLEPTDVEWPLAQFQATRFTRDDMHRLFATMNVAAGENKLEDDVAEKAFEKWWPDLERGVNAVLGKFANQVARPDVRSERDIVVEVLGLVRGIALGQEQLVQLATLSPRVPTMLLDPRFAGPAGVGGGMLATPPLTLLGGAGVLGDAGAELQADEASESKVDEERKHK